MATGMRQVTCQRNALLTHCMARRGMGPCVAGCRGCAGHVGWKRLVRVHIQHERLRGRERRDCNRFRLPAGAQGQGPFDRPASGR
eukprot:364930-Chlamydomonas_euryale.AAC.19